MLKFWFRGTPEKTAKPNILLIDDSEDVRAVTRVVLDIQGVGDLLDAASGQAGLDIARTQQPDVILLDLRLPDMSGESVLQLLKANPLTRDIPVILFTAFAGDLDILKKLPVSDIVLKPFDMQRLCAVVRRTLASPSSTEFVASLPKIRPIAQSFASV